MDLSSSYFKQNKMISNMMEILQGKEKDVRRPNIPFEEESPKKTRLTETHIT